jgi:hypothetical protein
MAFFTEIEKAILRHIWKQKRPEIKKKKKNLSKMKQGYIADMKLYYRHKISKTAWFWHKIHN